MGIYRDSVGNTYRRIVHGKADQPHSAKSSSGGTKKFGRNERKPHGKWGNCGCEFCRRNSQAFR
jgi:hypothetical protein